ncbi:MAG: type III pantothenate kinase [Bacteroidia bacterium]
MHFHLILDFGNTSLKAYLFGDNHIVRSGFLNDPSSATIRSFVGKDSINACVLASVIPHPEKLRRELQKEFPVLELGPGIPLPLKNMYGTPDTLGYDRLAAAIGARQLFPSGPVLAVVTGTCITYNIINADNQFIGGAIAPGLRMRIRAMHEFTAKLPMVELHDQVPLTGTTTEESLQSGTVNGCVAELKGMTEQYALQYPGLQSVVGGGDAAFLAKAAKSGIFARPELVAEGLNSILNYHVEKQLL